MNIIIMHDNLCKMIGSLILDALIFQMFDSISSNTFDALIKVLRAYQAHQYTNKKRKRGTKRGKKGERVI